jgi:hypothetical protein
MKKLLLALFFLGLSICVSGQLPTIHPYTLIPVSPKTNDQIKIVTHLETPNAAFGVDKQHTVTPSAQSVKLYLCYAHGMSTVLTHHIDTFAVGQLPQGVYTVQLNAYMSGAGQHCARIDSNSTSFSFTVGGTVGLKDAAPPEKIELYPNPAHDYVTLKPAGVRKVRIFSLQGQLVRSGETSSSGRWSLEGIAPGMYLLEVSGAQQRAFHPVIVH